MLTARPTGSQNLDLSSVSINSARSHLNKSTASAAPGHMSERGPKHRLELAKLQELMKENQNLQRPVIAIDFKLN